MRAGFRVPQQQEERVFGRELVNALGKVRPCVRPCRSHAEERRRSGPLARVVGKPATHIRRLPRDLVVGQHVDESCNSRRSGFVTPSCEARASTDQLSQASTPRWVQAPKAATGGVRTSERSCCFGTSESGR